jgi:hypothetical protein
LISRTFFVSFKHESGENRFERRKADLPSLFLQAHIRGKQILEEENQITGFPMAKTF